MDAQLYSKNDVQGNLVVTYQVCAADVATCKQFNPYRTCGPIQGFAVLLTPEVFGTNLNVAAASANVQPPTKTPLLRSAAATATSPPAVGVELTPPLQPGECVLLTFSMPRTANTQGRRLLQVAPSPSRTNTTNGTQPVYAWNPTFWGDTSMSITNPVFNAVILDNSQYGSAPGVINRNLSTSSMQLLASMGVSDAGTLDTSVLRLALGDSAAAGTPNSPVRPLYLRLFLTPDALNAPVVQPAVAAYFSAAGRDVTFTAAPPPQSVMNYTIQLSNGLSFTGPRGIPGVCLQNAVQNQPNNTCAVQVSDEAT